VRRPSSITGVANSIRNEEFPQLMRSEPILTVSHWLCVGERADSRLTDEQSVSPDSSIHTNDIFSSLLVFDAGVVRYNGPIPQNHAVSDLAEIPTTS